MASPAPKDTHIQHKDKKVVPKDVEDTPGQDGRRRPAGVSVIAEKGGQHLVKQKDRHDPLDRKEIGLGQGKQRLVRTEQGEEGGVQQEDDQPAYNSQPGHAQQGGGKIFPLPPALALAAGCAEQHGAADASQQAQAVYDIPHRGHHRHCRRSLRAVVLAYHGGVHQP